MLEGVFSEPLEISPRTWVLINSLWVGWFSLLAAANIYVARTFAESVWVNFKVFGISAAMLLFMIPQVIWLHGKAEDRNGRRAAVSDARREARLRRRLHEAFSPLELIIEDESHLHAGHAGAAGGQSHFRVRIVAEAFRGVPPLARHRLVYAALDRHAAR